MPLRSWRARGVARSPRSFPRRRGPALEVLEHRHLLASVAVPAPAPLSAQVQVQSTSLSDVAGSGVYGGTATLTATLTAGDQDQPLAGAAVAFALEEGGQWVDLGSATTDSSGLATLPGVDLTGFDAEVVVDGVAATFAGDASDAAASASGDLRVSPAPATITLGSLTTTYDGMPQAATVSTTPANLSGVSVTYVQDLLDVAAPTSAGSYGVTATLDDPNYAAADVTGTFVINQASPTITWSNPADIIYGTPLGPAELDATASVPGTFAYTQPAGIVLSAGAGQVLSSTFTPSDTVDYSAVTTTVMINVLPAMPVVSWTAPAAIIYGTPLGPAELDATASVPGSFTYTPATGSVPSAGAGQVLSATFTPVDTNDYTTVNTTTTIDVLPAAPVITWNDPPALTYGVPLGPAQLDASASTPGTFTYTPAAGTVLNAGNAQTLTVTFTPDDAADFTDGTASALLDVAQAPLTVTVNNAGKFYGQANPAFSVQYSGFVNGDSPSDLGGAPAFSTLATTTTDVGTYSVTAGGLTSSNYTFVIVPGTLTITPAAQTITWADPAGIVYGTPLDATELDASVAVAGPAPAGALAYTPAAGTILDAGADQVLTVVAAATEDYAQAIATVLIAVAKATPVITWNAPSAIIYGTPLGAAELNASVSAPDPGDLAIAYSPPAGTILPAGAGQVLSASTAATANDNAATATVTFNVLPATPTITWANPAAIVYGTPLGPAQLDAAASTAGTFTYTPDAGIILDAGSAQTLTATFTPADAVDFLPVKVTALINVAPAPLVVTAANATVTYGAALPALSGSVVGLANEDPMGVTFATAAMSGSPAGTYAIVPSLVDLNDRMSNYQVEVHDGTLTVTPAPLTVTASSARITVGQAIPAFTVTYDGFMLSDGPSVLGGSLTFNVPPSASTAPGVYPVMPGGLSAANYAITYVDGFLDVAPPPAPAPPVTVRSVSWQVIHPPGHNHKKTVRVLAVTFTGALDPSTAANVHAYHLVASSPGAASRTQSARSIPIPLVSAAYDAATNTVTLTPRGNVSDRAVRLTINPALVLDALGRPIEAQTNRTLVAT